MMTTLVRRALAGCGAVATVLVAGCGPSASERASGEPPAVADTSSTFGCSREQLEANRKLGAVINPSNGFAEIYDAMHPEYIQHNPIMRRFAELNGVEGREEFKLLNELAERGIESAGPPKPLPGEPEGDLQHLIIADCNHVFTMRKSYQLDPQREGQFYEVFDYDAWRIKDGKLVEHWDGLRLPQNAPPILTVPVKDMPHMSGSAGK